MCALFQHVAFYKENPSTIKDSAFLGLLLIDNHVNDVLPINLISLEMFTPLSFYFISSKLFSNRMLP